MHETSKRMFDTFTSFRVAILIVTSVYGQIPSIEITPNPVQIGSNFTVFCKVLINSEIKFFHDDIEQGSCPPPSTNLPCSPLQIQQSETNRETFWTQQTSQSHEGTWRCTRSNVDSQNTNLAVYKCPTSITSESGITSNVALNTSSSVTIRAVTDCIYPTSNPEILLQFISGSAVKFSTNMSCTTTGSSCVVGSVYECIQNISHEMALISGNIVPNTALSLQLIVMPSVGSCDTSLRLFNTSSVVFELTGTSPDSTNERIKWWIILLIFVGVCIIVGLTYIVVTVFNKKKVSPTDPGKKSNSDPNPDLKSRKTGDMNHGHSPAEETSNNMPYPSVTSVEEERKPLSNNSTQKKRKKKKKRDENPTENDPSVKSITTVEIEAKHYDTSNCIGEPSISEERKFDKLSPRLLSLPENYKRPLSDINKLVPPIKCHT